MNKPKHFSVNRGKIKAYIARNNLNQKDLACALGITPTSLSQKLNMKKCFTESEITYFINEIGLDIFFCE